MKKTYILIVLVISVILICVYIYQNLPKQDASNKQDKQNPSFVQDLITQEESGLVANPPASLTKCVYKNQIVYYLPSRCCDISSVLYNEDGDVICSPDGGFTGGGDGRCTDFFEERKNCEVIWKDSRSYS